MRFTPKMIHFTKKGIFTYNADIDIYKGMDVSAIGTTNKRMLHIGGVFMKKKLFAILLGLTVIAGTLPVVAWTAGTEHSHCVCGSNKLSVSGHTHKADQEWIGISDLSAIENSGYYYLTDNVERSSPWYCKYDVKLCLNGKNIISTANYSYEDSNVTIYIHNGKSLEITDCQETVGKITHGTREIGTKYVGRGITNYGTLTLWNGSVTGNSIKSVGAGVYINEAGTFKMYGGSISENRITDWNSGGGVYNCGVFIMTGGTIEKNYSKSSGGGVYNFKGSFNMSGTAAVKNNEANTESGSSSGGGVANYHGTFTMEGGTISGNKVGGNGGGGVSNEAAYGSNISQSAVFTMTGGTISDNEATVVGGGVRNSAGKDTTASFRMSGNAVIKENTAQNGGGVNNSGGATMTMEGKAEIKDNTAVSKDSGKGNGGGVCNSGSNYDGYPVFSQNGGTVSGNKAQRGGGIYVSGGKWNAADSSVIGNTADYGGGVHMGSNNTITLSGNMTITENKTKSKENNNLYMNLTKFRISAAELTDGAKIGISAPIGATLPMTITSNTATDNHFVSDSADAETAIDSDGYVVLREKTGTTYTVKINLPADGSASPNTATGELVQTVGKNNRFNPVRLNADSTHYFSNNDIKAINAELKKAGMYVATVSESASILITGSPTSNIEVTVVTTAKRNHSAPRVWGEMPRTADGKGYINTNVTKYALEYRKQGAENWSDFGGLIYCEVDAGYTYEVRFKETLTDLASPISICRVPVYSVPQVPEPTPGSYTYDGNEHTGITLGNDYVVSSGTNKATDAGIYTVFVKPAEGKEWTDGTSDAKQFKWSISKAEQKAPVGITGIKPTVTGANDGKITGVTSDMEYRKAGAASWTVCTGTEISGLEAGNYEVRYKATENYNASAAFTVTLEEGNAPVYELTVLGGSGSGKYKSGTTVTVTANAPKAGKEFDEWVIRSGDAVIADVNRATAAVTTKNTPATIEATYKDIVKENTPSYRIIEGADNTWKQTDGGALTFRANGDFSKFTGVKLDGIIIPSDKYTAVSGSTVITLKNSYLARLSAGTHTLTVLYNDGECSTNFEIETAASHTHSYGTDFKYDGTSHWHECACGDKIAEAAHTFEWREDKAAAVTENGLKHEECSVCGAKRSENTVVEKLPNSGKTSPKTGEDDSILMWFALLFVSGSSAVGAVILNKKRKYNT